LSRSTALVNFIPGICAVILPVTENVYAYALLITTTLYFTSLAASPSTLLFSCPTPACIWLVLPGPSPGWRPVRHAVVLRAVGDWTPGVVVLIVFCGIPGSRIAIVLISLCCRVWILVPFPVILLLLLCITALIIVIHIGPEGSTTGSNWRIECMWIWCPGSRRLVTVGWVLARLVITIVGRLGRLVTIAWRLRRLITVGRGLRWLVTLSWGNIGLDRGLVPLGRGLLVWTHRWLVALGRVCIVVFFHRGLLIGLIWACRLTAIFLLVVGTWWLVRIFWLIASGLVGPPWLVGWDREGGKECWRLRSEGDQEGRTCLVQVTPGPC